MSRDIIGAARPGQASDRLGLLALGLLVGTGLVAIAVYDFGSTLSFNDEFVYTWSVGQLVSGHGLRALPDQTAYATFQVLWSAAVSLGSTDPRLLRLTLLPFALLAGAAGAALARDLGADRFWTAATGAWLILMPISASLETSFMTDTTYLGLFVAATWAALRWYRTGSAAPLVVALTGLATLERQIGAGVAIALTVALLARPARPGRRIDLAWLLILWLVVAAAVLVPLRIAGTASQAAVTRGIPVSDIFGLVAAMLALPGIVGVLALPFLAAMGPRLPRSQTPQVIVAYGIIAGVFIGVTYSMVRLYPNSVFVGDYFNVSGLGPAHLDGFKVPLVPAPLFIALELLAVITFWLIPPALLRSIRAVRAGRNSAFLGLAALTQVVPIAHVGLLDRYYLPIAGLLVPILAGAASRAVRGRAWAIAVLTVALGFYLTAEQDYQAWIVARDQAAHLAYRMAPATRVQAGYEANAVYYALPQFERGIVPSGPAPATVTENPILRGPRNPCVRLATVGPEDQRPGVKYQSLAPGRIVLLVLRPNCE